MYGEVIKVSGKRRKAKIKVADFDSSSGSFISLLHDFREHIAMKSLAPQYEVSGDQENEQQA
jgi:hypothetical protein